MFKLKRALKLQNNVVCYSRVPNKRTLLLFFFQKFSLPICPIWLYMFIKCKKKGPTYTFIPAYTIILFTLHMLYPSIKLGCLAWVASLWSNLENLLNHSDTSWENNSIISPKIPPYTFYCHPICLLCNFKKSLAILLFGSSPSYTFIKFWEKFQPILLFRPVRLFGSLEYHYL